MSELQPGPLAKLQSFFNRDVCQRATKPLRNGIEIAIHINKEGPYNLTKQGNKIEVLATAPRDPDMSFWIGPKGIETLIKLDTEDIGEVGIAIMKLMLSSEPEAGLKAKVHIGSLQLLRNGYLGVLPLGGSTVMKFLGSKGFANIGKIKDAISNLRG